MTQISGSGALFDITGFVSIGATWDEYIYFIEDGAAVSLTGLSFQLQFRESETDTTAFLDLTTADGELVITNDDGSIASILRINVPYTTLSNLDGDYITDLVAKDVSDKLIHYGHGVVTFRQNPIAF